MSLWRWEGAGRSNAVWRGLFEIVGEYFASSSLPGYGWHQENMIYSSYFAAACNSSVGVFVCCSDVMLPNSAPCKVHSCYILPLVEGMQMWSAKTLIASFYLFFFLLNVDSKALPVFLFCFILFCTLLHRHPDGGTTPPHYCRPSSPQTFVWHQTQCLTSLLWCKPILLLSSQPSPCTDQDGIKW